MMTEQKDKYASITKKCFINAPFDQLQSGLKALFFKHSLQPEIGLEGNFLWTTGDEDFAYLAGELSEKGLKCTLHAPFFDLSPGAIDREIRETTRKKLHRAFKLTNIFKPESIVCHLGYEDNKHSYKMEEWLAISIETWSELLAIADESGTPVMFENTYEHLPDIHQRIFEQLPGTNFGFCLDVGHLMAYAGSTWQVWLEKLQPWLGQIHLHDNNGERDTHIAIGDGRFNFVELFDHLSSHDLSPLFTLEPHSEKDLWKSLKTIQHLGLFER